MFKNQFVGHQDQTAGQVAFLFSGIGGDYPGMGAQLYEHNHVFRKTIELGRKIVGAETGQDLTELLFKSSFVPLLKSRPSLYLPAMLVFEYALHRVWKAFGITPCAVAGFSLGEYAAGCAAGIFSKVTARLRQKNTPFPLTDIQHAYWLGRTGMFDLGNVSCHIYLEFDMENVNISKAQDALNQLIQRHGALRTIITEDGNQQVLSQVPEYIITRGEPGEETSLGYRGAMAHQVLPSGT